MNTKDFEVIAKLKRLIHKASVELASEYEKERYPYGEHEYLSKYQIITSCLDYGYGKIWDEYWNLKNELSFSVDYYDPDTTYEEDITAHYDALKRYLENNNIDINNIEMAPTKSIDDIYDELISTFTIENLCMLKIKLDNYINNSIYS